MDLSGFFVDQITLAPRTGQDTHGQSNYGPQQTIMCRVESGYALQQSMHSENLEFSHAICAPVPINPNDRIWLSNDDATNPNMSRMVKRAGSAETGDGSFRMYMAYL